MTMYDDTKLLEGISGLGLSTGERELGLLHAFYEEMVETNRVMNLTAITEYSEVVTKHFLDSLCMVKAGKYSPAVKQLLNGEELSVIDVGTGAGFPGIPLAIFFPKAHFTLLDSLNKRIRFLDAAAHSLGITNVTCVHGRAEELSRTPEYREKFDIVTSRAVARLAGLSELCLPFAKVNGAFLPLKAGDSETELSEAGNAIRTVGGRLTGTISYTVPESDLSRTIPVILKARKTEDKYPRGGGKPLKQPL